MNDIPLSTVCIAILDASMVDEAYVRAQIVRRNEYFSRGFRNGLSNYKDGQNILTIEYVKKWCLEYMAPAHVFNLNGSPLCKINAKGEIERW